MLKDRIREAMEGAKLSPAELARACQVTNAAAGFWLTGETKSLKAEKASLMETATGYRAQWIVSGKGPKKADQSNVSPLQMEGTGLRQVPIISSVQAGDPKEVVDAYQPGDGSGFVWTDRGSRQCFALKIEGDSMAPEFNPGDIIIIDPDVTPKPGRYVVAKCGNDQNATFKKYRPRGIDAEGREVFELVPINVNYGILQSDRDSCQIIGVMIEHRIMY